MDTSPVNVLLVEDDPVASRILQMELSAPGSEFHVHCADVLRQAMPRLRSGNIDVVLLDLNLPDSLGLSTLTTVVAEFPDVPIVVLTAMEDETLALTAIHKGAQDYLTKTKIQREWVCRAIRYAIERKRNQIELQRAKEAAEAASRAKGEFLAHMSHEIRNPLTSVLGYCENLLESELTADERRATVETILRNGRHMLEVVNDILDISKIEAGKLHVEQIACNPSQIAVEVISMLAVRAAKKNVSLRFEFDGPIPKTVLSDPTRLKQILINLASNAITFTQRGEVRLTLRLLPEGIVEAPDDVGTRHSDVPRAAHATTHNRLAESLIEFEVRDTGIGIGEEALAKLFRPFAQAANSTAREFGGTGLGLNISRQLARSLGGDIAVSSHLGQGATFRLRVATGPLTGVPMLDRPDVDHGNAPNDPMAAARTTRIEGRILLVEDGPDNQRLIAHILRRAGAEVEVADDGQQAVQMALAALEAGRPYDVILMDAQMPILDGYEATRTLRHNGYRRPIIALTASAMPSERERAMLVGCDDFATKPIDRGTLLDIVQRWIGRQNSAIRIGV